MIRAARRIVEKLRKHGHEAFFAGGWVRDRLLKRRHNDVDIATSAPPEEVSRIFPGSVPIGARFGVMQVRAYGRSYEVATFRSDSFYLDGRHPSSVSYSDPRSDALRRDFTINGLFYDPISDRVIDFVRGRSDLISRVIRTIGEPVIRFGEDKLRLLRAIRFACALNFSIDPATWNAILEMAPGVLQVSWERIRDEVLKILTGPDPERGLNLLQESGLLRQILPEVEAMRGVEQPPEYHPEGDVFVHTKLVLRYLRKPSPVLALGALLHDVGKPGTFQQKERIRFDGHVEAGTSLAEGICRRLRMSKDDTERVVELVRHHLRFMHVKEMRRSTLVRFLRTPHFEDHLELHRADCLGSHRDLEYYRFCREEWLRLRSEPAQVPRLINGDQLISMGYTPGPSFLGMLRAVEDLQIEGKLKSTEEAREYLLKTFPLPPAHGN